MKKIIIMVVAGLIVICSTSDVFLYAKKLLLGEPITHTIQQGEYFSKIAKEYYGSAEYWRELALINRAPNSDLVFPGEEIILPREDVLKQIRNTRWLSKVNDYVKGEEYVIAQLKNANEPKVAMSEPEPVTPIVETEQVVEQSQPIIEEKNEPIKSSTLPIILIIVGLVLVGSIIALVLYQRKKKTEKVTYIDDIDLSDDRVESEPDYKDYLKNKKEKVKEVVVD